MSAPLVPPPADDSGALSYPRTLQQWLDPNPVTKLDRVGTYLTLPAFSVTVDWLGYSDIVAAFNFECSKNFSLKGIRVAGTASGSGTASASGGITISGSGGAIGQG